MRCRSNGKMMPLKLPILLQCLSLFDYADARIAANVDQSPSSWRIKIKAVRYCRLQHRAVHCWQVQKKQDATRGGRADRFVVVRAGLNYALN